MPKQTYYNLDEKRRKEIDEACVEEFQSKPFHKTSVREICKKLDLSRAAFYKYFKSVEECYFYYLDKANFDAHRCLMNSIESNGYMLLPALENLPSEVGKSLFESNNVRVLRSFFVHRSSLLEEGWKEYKEENRKCECDFEFSLLQTDGTSLDNMDKMNSFISVITSISHGVIRECFEENWNRDKFEKEYSTRIGFLVNGIKK